jgi:hypothetical protein
MEDASSSSGGDVNRYIIIRKLIDSIFNTEQELHATTRSSTTLAIQHRATRTKKYRKKKHIAFSQANKSQPEHQNKAIGKNFTRSQNNSRISEYHKNILVKRDTRDDITIHILTF